uniref:Ileal sodium/bile acid cotransporter n=1 Tax=Ciona savignyi TaxID=51511 RepID=H2YTN3_CIOSA
MHHANASVLVRMQPIQANVSDVLLSESNENLNTSFQLTELNGTGLNIVTNVTDDGIPIMDFSHDPAKLAMDAAIKWFSICIMVEVMLGLGCAVDLEVLKVHIKRPIGVGVAGVCQFIIMPLIVFGLARALRLHKVAAVVMLVTASVPGGTLSNILAYLIDGDLALSMLMTSCSSILAFAFIP